MPTPLIEGLPLWVAETNAWFVAPSGPGGECVLIDAPPDPARILERLAALDLRLVALLSTHGHLDHVGGIGEVVRSVERTHDADVPVHIHQDDLHMLLDPVGTSGGFSAYARGVDLSPPEHVFGLDDGQQVSGAGMTFTSIHTPGHTEGSVCLRLDIDGHPPLLFSGDHLFAGSIGRTDMPGGSLAKLASSMVEKIFPMADEIVVHPGHGPSTTIGRERATNPFLLEFAQGNYLS
ncbi:MAG: MBL fold metallo-hydrolase [Acidimicrobiales bacterium]